MLRRLLTLLAVLSGFALVAEPALAAQASVVNVAMAGEAEHCRTVVAGPLMLVRSGIRRSAGEQPCPRPVIVVVTPTVQLQADRARE